ncbi:hypothetical protein [Okeania sp. SIO2B3]|nr:hypothetical protein [Okeania sp. SIO2B3]NET44771.1 hypothetical protein [Okeania sp. SIO2B3]
MAKTYRNQDIQPVVITHCKNFLFTPTKTKSLGEQALRTSENLVALG